MSRLIGPSRFPDGSLPNSRPAKRKSPSDLRREARRLITRLEQARDERRDGWPDGKDKFSVDRQERQLGELHGEKRGLRREVFAREPDLEGTEYRRNHPGRTR